MHLWKKEPRFLRGNSILVTSKKSIHSRETITDTMNKFTYTMLLCCFVSNANAQNSYDPKYLIPYNDRGKCGWSDTLGVMRETPKFDSTGFFHEYESIYYADVLTDGGVATYIYQLGLSSPNGYLSGSFYKKILIKNNLSFIKDNKGNYGLFNYKTQKILVLPQFTNYVTDETGIGFVMFKGVNGKLFQYNIKTNKLKETEFNEFIEDRKTEAVTYKKDNGLWFKMTEAGGFLEVEEPVIETESMDYLFGDDFFSLSDPEFKFHSASGYSIVTPEKSKVYSTIELGRYGVLEVVCRSGKFGLVDNSLKEYLPYAYDFIDIDYINGYFMLFKEGKMGVKMITSTYPMIQPKYDFMEHYINLKVSKSWSFVLFNVVKNGMTGYVGENGVEYFK